MAEQIEQVDFTDYVGENYESRHTDEHGNGDDLYTEEEAVALAKEEGVEFIDSFTIVKISDFSRPDNKEYNTIIKAKNALAKLADKDEYTIQQIRHQK